MSLKDVSAKLSTNGSRTLLLVHGPSGKTIQELSLVPADPEHRSFIIGTWVKSYRPHARKQGIGEFYDKCEPAIAESRWQDCLVATDEDGFTIYAWVCGYPSELIHAYVIPDLRHIGVAGAMIEDQCGPVPDLARPWPGRHKGRVNPYLLKVKDGNGK